MDLNEIVELRKGPSSINGVSDAQVLQYQHQYDGGNGCRPYGIVLCFRPNHRVTGEYVVWRAIYDEDREFWFAEQGHYTTDKDDAFRNFEERADTKVFSWL